MKVADHTLLTPFILVDRQTGRQGKRQRVAELLQITAFPSLHQACQACNRRPSLFPLSFPYFLHSPPTGVTLIGGVEFKGPASG